MNQRIKYDWPTLLKAFDASGLSQTAFCKQNNLNPKYFSLKRSKLLASSVSEPAFQKVVVESRVNSSAPLVIQIGRCKIECPSGMSMQQVATLVQSLA